MSELLNVTGVSAGAMVVAAIVVAGTVITLVSNLRQRAALAQLDERISQLSAGLSLLTNTSEEGFRSIAAEIDRLANASEHVRYVPAQEPASSPKAPRPQMSPRERIALAAVGGRSVQEIAASEHLSEGEVLLHMLMEKLKQDSTLA